MDAMRSLALRALEEMPPVTRFQPGDAEIIARHRDFLLGIQDTIVGGFYDTIFDHPATAAVFNDGEREDRESTLSNWWRRTIEGPLDEDYYAWMALVGLVHVIRRVSNPMMLSMASYVRQGVIDVTADADLDAEERQALTDAVGRLMATVGAIITYSYDHAVVDALFNVAGMPPALLERLRDQEASTALNQARKSKGHS